MSARVQLCAAALLVAVACHARGDEFKPLAPLTRDVTVVAFWATWCGPCRAELPRLEQLYQKYKDDPHVAVVAVSVDRRGKAEEAKALARSLGLTAPQLTDGKALYFRLFGGDDTEVPRLAVIDRRRRGLEAIGAPEHETPELFLARMDEVIAAVRAGKPLPDWQPVKLGRAHPDKVTGRAHP